MIRSCMYQGVPNVGFSENFTCFVSLKHPFWDSPFWLITDSLFVGIIPFPKMMKSFYQSNRISIENLQVSKKFTSYILQALFVKTSVLKVSENFQKNFFSRVKGDPSYTCDYNENWVHCKCFLWLFRECSKCWLKSICD